MPLSQTPSQGPGGSRERAGERGASYEVDAIPVRALTAQDTDQVARIDATSSGRSRPDYFRRRIEAAQREGGISLSLAAEIDGLVVGFLIASVDYGEFGVTEPVAVVDTVGVHPEFRGRHVGRALMRQLALNLQGLRIERVRTEVEWSRGDLLGYFRAAGFTPMPRLVLEASAAALPRD